MIDLQREQPGVVALEGRGLSKRYGATQALSDVSIRLEVGHLTALAGGNGAGKSTLVRLLTGVEKPDDGDFLRDGEPIKLQSRHDATSAGIFCVYQDQPVVDTFPVYRQMYLGYESQFRRRGMISDRLMRSACSDLLKELSLTSISAGDRMGSLSPAARELVALAGVVAESRLLQVPNPVILLDEPTSALSAEEMKFFVDFISSLKANSAMMFVSHRITEVLDWADEVYVLRDSRNADHMTRAEASDARVHEAMGGRAETIAPSEDHSISSDTSAVTQSKPAKTARPLAGRPVLSVAELKLRQHLPVFDFEVRAGEIVGLAGVEGSGKEELLRLCAGLGSDDGSESASIDVDGSPRAGRLRELLGAGVVYLSGDRQRDGVFGRLSIAENMAVSRRVAAMDKSVLIRRSEDRARARDLVQRLAVKAASVNAPLQSLSGGNQQKVLLGRCLELSPRVMLLDNVTRGVDIGAKETIYQLLQSLADQGVAIVLASDDLAELASVADRVLVLKGGQLVREFDNRERDVPPLAVLAAMV
jgi:ribose transport system ATP-binding protein